MVAYSERERGGSSSGKLLGNSSASYNAVHDTGVNGHNGVESQGKRKNKNLDISLTVEEVGTGNGDELQGKTEKMKKKKKKKESTSPVTVEDVDAAGNGCGDESQGKRKKKKNIDISLTVEEVGTGNADELQGKTEKKKKKRESTSPVTVEDVDEVGDESVRKKKKNLDTSPTVEYVGTGGRDELQGKREKKKKKKKKKKRDSVTVEEVVTGGGDELQGKKEKKRKKRESTPPVQSVEDVDEAGNGCADESQRKKRKKKNLTTSQTVEDCGPGTESAMKKPVLITQELQTSNGGESIRKTKKKVSFRLPDSTQEKSPENEVLAEETEMNHKFTDLSALWATDRLRPNLVWGMYTPEEDEALKQAVFDYIKEQGWEQEYGLEKIMNSKNSEASGCWHTIRKCLPQREIKRLHARAHRLFDPGNYLGKWTPEETRSLIELHSVHGNDWKKISTIIGRDASNVKDKWRIIKSGNQNTGPWAPEEQQKLRALVLKCLHVRRQMAKKGLLQKHHKVVRDEISWEFIAEQMEGRNRLNCMAQWYNRMASSMVTTGQWSNGDDQRLLERLMEEFPLSEELIEWDSLLENRSGEVCKRRWDQMQRCFGKQSVVRHLHFLEKLENLVKVFAPHLLDAEYDQQFAADMQRADADADKSEDDADT